jgi:putative PIN family toxin of toxin-antitoxin system
MPGENEKIVIDTNLWISFLLTTKHARLDQLFSEKKFILLFSQELMDEFMAVSQRPKFKKYFSITDLQNLLEHINESSEFISVTSNVRVCRDIKDNFLLSLAKDGEATHLITGDKDLLDLKHFGKTKIITITDYLSED